MRPCLINAHPRNTGIGRYSFELFDNLRESYPEARMVYLNVADIPFPETSGVKVRRMPFGRQFLNKLIAKYLLPYGDSYEITHITEQGLTPLVLKVNNPVITCHGLKSYVLDNEMTSLTSFFVKLEMKLLGRAKRIIAPSKFTKQKITKHLNIGEEKVSVVPYGIDLEAFRPRNRKDCRKKLGLPVDKRILLNVGVGSPHKNIPNLLKAFYKLQKEVNDVLLLRVGKSKSYNIKIIKKLRLQKKVKYAGVIPSKFVPYYYNAADLFVFPSLHEGFGYPPLEAMASGVPVICSNRAAIPEVVGDAAIKVDPTVDKLFEWMKKVLQDSGEFQYLRGMGPKQATKFGWEKIVEEMANLYVCDG